MAAEYAHQVIFRLILEIDRQQGTQVLLGVEHEPLGVHVALQVNRE